MMELRPNTRFIEKHLNIVSDCGGLGDHIARIPAIRFIGREHPHVRLTVYWYDYFLPLAKILAPEHEMLRHKRMSDLPHADDMLPQIDFKPEYLTSLGLSLIDHGFLVLTQRVAPTEEDYVYPKYHASHVTKIYSDYIAITPCFTSKAREWKGEEINKTIKGIHEMGFKTILLGDAGKVHLGNGVTVSANLPEGFNPSLATLNLLGETDLLECLDVISQVKCIVGVDNGLLHLSACTDTPSVWGFTSVLASQRIPLGIEALCVLPEVSCYGCQSRTYLVKHDFRKCMFDDYLCIEQMRSEKFLHQIKKILDIS